MLKQPFVHTYRFILLMSFMLASTWSLSAQAQNPSPPSNLAVEVRGADAVDLSWQDNSTNEIGFNIFRSDAGGAFSFLGRSEVTLFEDRNSGLEPLVEYCYQVSAFNANGTSVPVEACLTIPALPAAPSNLTAVQNSPNSIVQLDWQDNADDETEYNVYRQILGGRIVQIAELGPDLTSFEDHSIISDGTHCYFTTAGNAAGESGESAQACVDIRIADPVLPVNLSATTTSSAQILLVWELTVFNYQNLLIERGPTPNGPWEQVGIVTERTESYLDIGLDSNSEYCYRVQAENIRGSSDFSEAVCDKTEFATPPVPTVVRVSAVDSQSVNVTWEAPDLSDHAFRLERRLGPNAEFETLVDALEAFDFVDTNLEETQFYCYRVQMFNPLFESAFSEEACGIVQPPHVVNLQVVPNINYPTRSLSVDWQPGGAPDNLTYTVLYREIESDTWSDPTVLSSTTHTIDGLDDGTRYQVRVVATRTIRDLTESSNPTDGRALTFVAFWPGDSNGDGMVSAADIVQLTSPNCYGASTAGVFDTEGSDVAWQKVEVDPGNIEPAVVRCDTDRNGVVDIFDFLAIAANAGRTTGTSQAAVPALIVSDTHRNRLISIYHEFTPQTEAEEELRDELARILGLEAADVPDALALHPGYPNPFQTSTTLIFDLPESQSVRLSLFNALGQEILVLVEGELPAGRHSHILQDGMLPTGVYFLVMKAGAFIQTKTITRVK